MSKWTQDPTYPRIIIDEDRQAICEILGDSARQAAAFTCLIAEAPAMAEELALESGVTIPGLATMNRTRALLARLEAE